MITQLGDFLTQDEVAAVKARLDNAALWEDGGKTADGRAQEAKNNLQAKMSAPDVKEAIKLVHAAFNRNMLLRALTRPATIVKVMFNRYDEGMEYGAHVDKPYMDNIRTDISFTVFLSGPSDYDGGALMIDGVSGGARVKSDSGSIVVYPSNHLHWVEKVSRGSRLAAVGWIKSNVRSPEQRALLFDIDRALAELQPVGNIDKTKDRLENLRNGLLRMWGE